MEGLIMANLKGNSKDFNKQIKAVNHLLAAFSQRHHGSNSHKTFSDATRVKRDKYLKDFKEHLEDKAINEGKLNELMTEVNLTELFESKLDGLTLSAQEDYIRGWSGMIQGLQESNITIDIRSEFFAEAIDNNAPYAVDSRFTPIDPSINPMDIVAQLPESSAALAQLQYETGYRVSEAYDAIDRLETVLHGLRIMPISGKGGQYYHEKIISIELRLMLLKLKRDQVKLPHQSTYYRHLQRFGMRSHDFRTFYAKELFESTLEELKRNDPSNSGSGNSSSLEKAAASIVSKAINHHRTEVTFYYLDKFEDES